MTVPGDWPRQMSPIPSMGAKSQSGATIGPGHDAARPRPVGRGRTGHSREGNAFPCPGDVATQFPSGMVKQMRIDC